MKIELKSAAFGLALGILAMVAIAAESSSTPSGGRYQLVTFSAGPGAEPNAMIIDTSTGKVWSTKLTSNWRDSGGSFWDAKEGK